MVTLKDIAERVGVSMAAVSFVLGKTPQSAIQRARMSAKTRNAIEKAARELGYRPNQVARSMVMGKSRVIAFVTSEPISQLSTSQIAIGILSVAASHQYLVHFAGNDWKEHHQAIVDECLGHRVCGAIFHKIDRQYYKFLFGEFQKDKVPLVLTESESVHPWGKVIQTDYFMGGYMGTEHLISLGHRRIAHLSLPTRNGALREKGYRAAMKKAGLKILPGYCQPGGAQFMELDDTTLALDRLFEKSRNHPTALFCSNDRLASIAMNLMQERGKNIPGDLSVVGHSSLDSEEILVTSPMTTVNQPYKHVGELATQHLIEALDLGWEKYASKAETIPLRAVVKIRQSTAPPPLE